MSYTPLIAANVRITVKDINNNSILKIFNAVTDLRYDYSKGMVEVVDVTGAFYFPINTLTTITYTIVTGVNGSHAVVMT